MRELFIIRFTEFIMKYYNFMLMYADEFQNKLQYEYYN